MTWAEFRIRLFAYKRLELKEWEKVRFIAYQTYISNWYSKKKPKSIENYLPLDHKKRAKLNNKMQERIKQAQEEYFRQKQALENG